MIKRVAQETVTYGISDTLGRTVGYALTTRILTLERSGKKERGGLMAKKITILLLISARFFVARLIT